MQYFLASGGGLLSFETGFGIWVAISTLLFLYLMNKFLVPPIMEALNKRESQIKDSLESAEKALAKAEQISKDNAKALKEAEIQRKRFEKRQSRMRNCPSLIKLNRRKRMLRKSLKLLALQSNRRKSAHCLN